MTKKSLFLFFIFSTIFSLKSFSQNETLKKSKWGFEVGLGMGFADLVGEKFEITGISEKADMLVKFTPDDTFCLVAGLGISEYRNGNLTFSGFNNTNAQFIDLPVKMRLVSGIKKTNLKFYFGIGFLASALLSYDLKNENGTSKIDYPNVWNFSMPYDLGFEYPINDDYEIGVCYETTNVDRKITKDFMLKKRHYFKISFTYRF